MLTTKTNTGICSENVFTKEPGRIRYLTKKFFRTLFTDIMRYYIIFILMLMVRALQSSGFIPLFFEIP